MKVLCEKCGNNLSSAVSSKFRLFQTGRIRCAKCRKRYSRYISILDLYIYNFANILVFAIAIALIQGYSMLNLDKSYTVLFISLLVGLVALIKFVFSNIAFTLLIIICSDNRSFRLYFFFYIIDIILIQI